MTYNYTDTFRLAMELTYQRAKELGAVEVTPDLLLYGIIRQGSQACIEHLRQNGIADAQTLLNQYEEYITQHTPRREDEEVEDDPVLGAEARTAILAAVKLSQEIEDVAVSPLHLLCVLMEGEYKSYLKSIVSEQGATYAPIQQVKGYTAKDMLQDIKEAFQTLAGRMQEEADEDDEEEEDEEGTRSSREQRGEATPSSRRQRGSGHSKTPMIDRFGRDITALAREGKLDPVIGREGEIERMCHILGRRRKCNPILIGEPGVGKTTLVEGLAQRIVRQEVPRHLLGKRLIEIDLSAMVAGTKYRGQFEERIKDLVEELEACSDVIMYVDEIHTMVGAGGGSSSMDAANMLKPALARGTMQCIGATTLEEYRKHIEKDRALERRFQKLMLEPSTAAETLLILQQLRPHYEEHHQVRFSDAALQTMVQMAERYINDRHFPDKAIDLMDEAGAKYGSQAVEEADLSPLTKLEEEKADCLERKLSAIKEQKFELAASYRNRERELEQAIAEAKEKLKAQAVASYPTVEVEHIAEVVARMTAIPVQNIASGERERLRNLAQNLQVKVIGQNDAVQSIARSIKRNRLGLRDGKRPIGSFLFLGPTGVGKTYLVKTLAEQLFGTQDALIRVDMSEYMEKFAVSRLVGAPPGYVGHDEGGQLTEQVRRRPYSIVLFDEVEKAHADVYNLLLQVLDEGYLTDSYGRRVDFRNTIIVLTSNVGSREARSFGRGIGYQEEDKSLERTADIIRKSLNKTFSPEFLNRLDDIITFAPLNEEAIRQIVDVELSALHTRLTQMGYGLELDDLAMQALAKQAYSPEYGARPLRRTLQSEVEDRLTDLILEEAIKEGDALRLTALEGKITQVKD